MVQVVAPIAWVVDTSCFFFVGKIGRGNASTDKPHKKLGANIRPHAPIAVRVNRKKRGSGLGSGSDLGSVSLGSERYSARRAARLSHRQRKKHRGGRRAFRFESCGALDTRRRGGGGGYTMPAPWRTKRCYSRRRHRGQWAHEAHSLSDKGVPNFVFGIFFLKELYTPPARTLTL